MAREALGPRKVAIVEKLAKKGRDSTTDKDSYKIFCEIVATIIPAEKKPVAKKKRAK